MVVVMAKVPSPPRRRYPGAEAHREALLHHGPEQDGADGHYESGSENARGPSVPRPTYAVLAVGE